MEIPYQSNKVVSRPDRLYERIVLEPRFFLESLVEITDKDRQTVPFILNPSQCRYYNSRTLRDIILKPRQLGFSTEIMGLFLHDTMFVPNTVSVIVAHTDKDASDLFERARFMFNSIPNTFKPNVGRSNVRELFFDKVNSRFFIGSAEAKHFGICVHPEVKVLGMDGFAEEISKVGVPTIQWDGDLISITPYTSPEPIIVTPNHLILTQNGWKEADKLTLEDAVAQPIRKIIETLQSITVRIPNYKKSFIWSRKKINLEELKRFRREGKTLKQLKQMYKLDIGTINRYLKLNSTETKVRTTYQNVEVPLTKEFGWIIGMMLAEGFVGGGHVEFSLNKKEMAYADRIVRFFEKYTFQSNLGRGKRKKWAHIDSNLNKGSGFNHNEYSQGIRVVVCNTVWQKFFKETFYKTFLSKSKGRVGYNTKYIPDWVFDAPKEFCKGLIHGLIDGDGCEKVPNIISYGSSRPQLLYQFRDLMASLYGWCSIGKAIKVCCARGETYNNWLRDSKRIPKREGSIAEVTQRSSTGLAYKRYIRLVPPELKVGQINKQKYYQNEKFVYQKIKKIERIYYKGQLYDMIDQPEYRYRTVSGVIHNSKTINNLHITEASHPYYKEDFLIGIMESVPRSGRIVLESTARGEGNIYHIYYMDAKEKHNEFKVHYYRWFEHSEYQIALLPGERLNLDEEERELIKKFRLTMSQIKWRREKKGRLGKKFIQEYPELEDDDAFIKSGSPVFDGDWLKARDRELLEQNPQEIWLGGDLFIYKIAEGGARYVIGADTSEGDINSDFSAASVIKCFPLPIEQVALLVGRWTPDIFSEKVYKMGLAYNKAIIGVERNNHGHAVLLNLSNGIVRAGAVRYPPYPEIYAGLDRKLGWLTSGLTKPIMIEELDRAMRSGQLIVNSKRFLSEARKFQYAGANKMGAPSGAHDDIVMANAVAIMVIASGGFDWSFT